MKKQKVRDMQLALLQKGFIQQNKHHEMYWFFYKGKRTSIRTRISHGKREYEVSLMGAVRTQMKLRGNEIDEFFDCQMSREDYAKLLIRRGEVRPSA